MAPEQFTPFAPDAVLPAAGRKPADAVAARVRSRRSTSARLLWLVLAIVVVIELLVVVPDLARERVRWLRSRISTAEIAALSAIQTISLGPDSAQTIATRNEFLRASGIEAINFHQRNTAFAVFGVVDGTPASKRIYLFNESRLTEIMEALEGLIGRNDQPVEVVGDPSSPIESQLHLVVDGHELNRDLREFATSTLFACLLIAAVSVGALHVALLLQLVRPIRRITDSIVAFRADPEHATPLDVTRISRFGNDEMAFAARELSAMQQELRSALWRNSRLAALGTAVAKVSHDLRGILTTALLSAERLQLHPDPAVRRSGETLVEAVDRATDLVRGTLEFAREGPSATNLEPVALGRLVDEVAASLLASGTAMRVENRLDGSVVAAADTNQLMRVLSNLLRNAAEAGSSWARVGQAPAPDGMVSIDIADEGPGLPEATQANLFRPFVVSARRGGNGLGLAISRDLMRAHGGDIRLVSTGPEGTVFRLTLLGPERIAGSQAAVSTPVA